MGAGSPSQQRWPISSSCFSQWGLVGTALHSVQITLQMISEQQSVFHAYSAQRWLLLTF